VDFLIALFRNNLDYLLTYLTGTEPTNERAMHNLEHYRQMITEEETETQRSRQVIDYNPKLKNERVLDGVRASPDFDAYERLCRGEPLPREVWSVSPVVYAIYTTADVCLILSTRTI